MSLAHESPPAPPPAATSARPRPPAPPHPLAWRRKLTFTLLLTAAAVLVAELGLRVRQYWRYGTIRPMVYGVTLEIDPQLGIAVPRAGMTIRGSRLSLHTNSLGFRGAEITREKPPGTVRIACLGASTTYCAEASSDAATWPGQLERLLTEKYPQVRFEVINAGIPGCRIEHTRINLEQRVLPLAPDLVIEYEAHNDLKRATRDLAEARGLIPPGARHRSDGATFVSRHSVLGSLVEHNGRIWLNQIWPGPRLHDVPPEVAAPFRAELEELERLLAEREIPLVISLFLPRYRRQQPVTLLADNVSHARYYAPWLDEEGWLTAMDVYNQVLREVGREHGLVVVDAAEQVPGDGEHYFDSIHFSDQGCLALARRLAETLDQSGLLAPLVARAAAAARPPQ